MVTISAAAHALDALYGALNQMVTVPNLGQSAARHAYVRTSISLAHTIDNDRARKWKDDFTWLFGLRDSAVHFHESFSAPAPHPISGHGSPAAAHYCLETARRAVDLLLDVLKVIVNAETARNADARTYATNMRPTVDRLCCQGS